MNDFTALVTQFGQWLQARNLDPEDYSLAIVAPISARSLPCKPS